MCYSPNYIGPKDNTPKYMDLLSGSDRDLYTHLRARLSSQICRNRRGKRIETFIETLNFVQKYCIRGCVEDDRCRCLVCGVCWVNNGIAVNTRQLGMLVDKCKSSINGSLQKMGYSILPSRSISFDALIEVLPMIKSNFTEVREWTVRLFCSKNTNLESPNICISPTYPITSQSSPFSLISNIHHNNDDNRNTNPSFSKLLPGQECDQNENVKYDINHQYDSSDFRNNNPCQMMDNSHLFKNLFQSDNTAVETDTKQNHHNKNIVNNKYDINICSTFCNSYKENNVENHFYLSNNKYSNVHNCLLTSEISKTQESTQSPKINELLETRNQSDHIFEGKPDSIKVKSIFELDGESDDNEINSIFYSDSFCMTSLFLFDTPNNETEQTMILPF